MVSAEVDTADALEALPFPVVTIAPCAAVRTALFEAALAEVEEAPALAVVSASGTTLFDTAKVGLAAEAAAAEIWTLAAGVDVAVAINGDPTVTEPALS